MKKAIPLNNPEKFKTKPYTGEVLIPENELIVGGDAPHIPKSKEQIQEIEDLYNTFLKKK